MHFLLRDTPLDLSPDRLRGLRLSLNTPVVSIEELPTESARAAIAVHDEIDGRPNITVGICSVESGAAILFSFEGDLRDHSALTNGIDAALSFGESMGFLFDEDELEASSPAEARSRALGLWLELVGSKSGDSEAGQQTAEASASGSEQGFEAAPEVGEVLLLDQVADSEEDLPGLRSEEPDRSGSEPPVPLSKFRHSAPSAPPCPGQDESRSGVGESPTAAKRAALGRLKLVKRRKGRGDAASKASVIRRLLSSF
jgi:hypothetical protein